MKWILNKIPKSLKDIGTLIFGNSFAALFPIVLAPILTRIYTESEFGVYTTYLAVVTIFCSFSTGRYDIAILESQTRNIAKHLAILASVLTICVSTIAFIVLPLIPFLFPKLENISELGYLLYIIPLTILLVSFVQISTQVLNREKQFKEMAGAKIIRTGLGSVMQVGSGYLNFSYYGLVIGKLLGDLISLFYGLHIIIREKVFANERIHTKRIKYVAKKFDKYLKINSIHSFLNISTTSSIPILLGVFFDSSIVGYYGLSFSVCFLPVTLISQAVFQIFSREFSVRIDEGKELVSYFKSTIVKLALVSIPIFVVLILFGDILFEIVFGVNWKIAGVFAQILTPYLFSTFVVSPFAFVALRLNKHSHIFKIELVNMVLRISSIIIGSIYFNEFIALVFFSISGLVVNIYLILWIAKIIRLQRS